MNKLVYLDANVLAYAARGGRYSFLIDRKLFFSFRRCRRGVGWK